MCRVQFSWNGVIVDDRTVRSVERQHRIVRWRHSCQPPAQKYLEHQVSDIREHVQRTLLCILHSRSDNIRRHHLRFGFGRRSSDVVLLDHRRAVSIGHDGF